ncbi:hypothetical protein EWM64_g6048 [Hericium alpestre]|uniref:Uncharacterized protein n=1 Tax=Hericium alpestre TaxID=135208 RepID=A0A4Y9ZV90_9AGAM|nr:hypothetical protein EWM64_g6048 [Hericium alpestre]
MVLTAQLKKGHKCSQCIMADAEAASITYSFGVSATYDVIDLGEDGLTHQPVETAIQFCATPSLAFWYDSNETSAADKVALESQSTPFIISY